MHVENRKKRSQQTYEKNCVVRSIAMSHIPHFTFSTPLVFWISWSMAWWYSALAKFFNAHTHTVCANPTFSIFTFDSIHGFVPFSLPSLLFPFLALACALSLPALYFVACLCVCLLLSRVLNMFTISRTHTHTHTHKFEHRLFRGY